MASTQPLPVPERQPEPAARRAAASVPRPVPDARKPRFAIKVRGMIPN
jgi:hypothetical protein